MKNLLRPSKMKESFEKQWPCCKNVWLSLKTNSAFKIAFKFQGKNAHSTVLQNAWSQKDQHSHWKNKFNHQKPIVFIEKRSWVTKKPRAPWKINYGHPKLKILLKSNDLLQKRMTFFENQFFLKRPSNSKEKTPTTLSYKMLEAKKTNTLIEKTNLSTKNQ